MFFGQQTKKGLTPPPEAQDLADVLALGNTTGANDIVVSAGQKINLQSATASEIAGIDASKNLISLPVATYPSLTELSYVKGLTSAVQAQLNGKQASLGYTAENVANKDATGGYAGLTLFKINFKNVANTFTSFLTNINTAARTYTFQDRNGTIADDTDLALKANLASPTFTGIPAAPTAGPGANTTQIATTGFVQQEAAYNTAASKVFNFLNFS